MLKLNKTFLVVFFKILEKKSEIQSVPGLSVCDFTHWRELNGLCWKIFPHPCLMLKGQLDWSDVIVTTTSDLGGGGGGIFQHLSPVL